MAEANGKLVNGFREELGRNSMLSFDAVVGDILRAGLWLTQRNALITAARDPRIKKKHMRVLAEIMEHTNRDSGVAFPGRKALSEDTRCAAGGVEDIEGPYSESTIAKIVSDLLTWGYLIAIKRAPAPGRRALAHYACLAPPDDKLKTEIAAYFDELRRRGSRSAPKFKRISDQPSLDLPDPARFPHVPERVNVTRPNVPERVNVSRPVVPGPGNVRPGATFQAVGTSAPEVPGRRNVGADPVVPEKRANVPNLQANVPPLDPTVTGKGTGKGTWGARASAQPERRSDFWNVKLNPTHSAASEQVSWGDDGRLQVSGNFRAELLKGAGGDEAELQRQLDQAVAYVGRHLSGYGLMQAVRSQLAKQRGWAAQKAATATTKPTAAPAAQSATAAAEPDAEAVLRARLVQAMRQAWPYNGMGARPWPTHELGPAPGKPGCRLSVKDQVEVWHSLLESARSDVPNWRTFPERRLGYAIYNRMRMWWSIDATSPDCPIPRSLLEEFRVPLTKEAVDAIEAEKQAERAARAQSQPLRPSFAGYAEHSSHAMA